MKIKTSLLVFLSFISNNSWSMGADGQPPVAPDHIEVAMPQGVPGMAPMGSFVRVAERIDALINTCTTQCAKCWTDSCHSCGENCGHWREGCREDCRTLWTCRGCGACWDGCCRYDGARCCAACVSCVSYSCGLWLETLCEPRCRALKSDDAFRCGCVCGAKIIFCPATCLCSYCGYACEECYVASCRGCHRYNWREFESLFYGR